MSTQSSMADFIQIKDGEWQTKGKKRKISRSPEEKQTKSVTKGKSSRTSKISVTNRFGPLDIDGHVSRLPPLSEDKNSEPAAASVNSGTSQKKEPNPQPIFLENVVNHAIMVAKMKQYLGNNSFVVKTLANNTVRVSVGSADDNRRFVRELCSHCIEFYTYQIKSDRAFKVVMRHLD